MARAFIGVGSNINAEGNVRRALHRLAREVRVVGISTVYRTQALDRPGPPEFYNCVVEVETQIPPAELKRVVLRRIEQELGRVRARDQYAPRTIDLDLLIYGDLVITTPQLVIPDPEIARRPFLAIPLYELAPELVLPGSGQPIKQVAAGLASQPMEPLAHYTKLLRRDIENELSEGATTDPGAARRDR